MASFALALALMLSLALAGVTAARILRVEQEFQPAVEDARKLGAALDATRMLLRDGRLGGAESRLARADSEAQRFHLVATDSRRAAGQRPMMLGYDAAFGAYYVAARRAAVGLSMSADADGSSAVDAALGYLMLRQNLAAGLDAQWATIEGTRPATAPVELASWIAMALLSAAALLRRAFARRVSPPQGLGVLALDDCHVPVRAGDGPAALRLHEAVERMARQRLATAIAAGKVAKRNNERQIELSRSWNAPMLSILPAVQTVPEMDVYEDEQAESAPVFGGLRLVSV